MAGALSRKSDSIAKVSLRKQFFIKQPDNHIITNAQSKTVLRAKLPGLIQQNLAREMSRRILGPKEKSDSFTSAAMGFHPIADVFEDVFATGHFQLGAFWAPQESATSLTTQKMSLVPSRLTAKSEIPSSTIRSHCILASNRSREAAC